MVQMFVPSVSRPTRQEVEKEIQKLYPDAKVMSFLPRDLEPGEPTVMMGEEKRDEYGDIVGGPKISKKEKKKNLAKNEKDEDHTTTTSESVNGLPGLGGGGGGTNAITGKSKGRTLKGKVTNVAKVLTRPLHKKRVDPNEKFAESMNSLPGLGGGGGGTDAITMKSRSKSIGKRLKDVGKVLTRPLHKKRVDPNEKFAS